VVGNWIEKLNTGQKFFGTALNNFVQILLKIKYTSLKKGVHVEVVLKANALGAVKERKILCGRAQKYPDPCISQDLIL
jgi:hypothetical protein